MRAITVALGGLIPGVAYAQAEVNGEASSAGLVTLIVLLLGLGLLVGVIAKVIDRKRRREEEAVLVQAKASDALLTDSSLGHLPVTVTAHAPFRSGSPVVVEIVGRVARPDQRDAVIRLVMREVAAIRPDYQLVDRLTVDPAVLARAA